MITNIHFSLYEDLYVKVDTDNVGVLKDIEEFLTSHKKGYIFMPKYRAGVWDGKISLFRKATRTFPFGLLLDVLGHLKKEWSEDTKMSMDSDVRGLFGGGNKPEFQYNLLYPPYPYQQECIESLVKTTKGLVVVATAGGKSLIISYIIDNLPKDQNKSLIIVPTLQLIDQFQGDMIEYGFPDDSLGAVNASKKEFDKSIVISTWQSLGKNLDKLDMFDCVICDECHTASASTISEIMKSSKAKYRFGVTGTLPTNKLDAMTVKSFIGPVLKTFTGKDLGDMGYISKCVIKQVHIKYNKSYGNDYNTIRDEVFIDPFRLSIIKDIVRNATNNVLVLVERVEKEGDIITQYLTDNFPDKQVVFISGKDKSSVRNSLRLDMNTKSGIICVATFGVFQMGTNIPALREIILASSSKSFIRVIQSLGRVLRKHVSKELGGAVLWDLCDGVKHLKEHGNARYKHYTKEKHSVEELHITEK